MCAAYKARIYPNSKETFADNLESLTRGKLTDRLDKLNSRIIDMEAIWNHSTFNQKRELSVYMSLLYGHRNEITRQQTIESAYWSGDTDSEE
jgi:hypothetical protein